MATKTRILVVEDEALIRLFLVEALAEAGYEVVEAADGDQAALAIAGPDHFHLVLTDLQMPGSLDGIAVASQARQRHKDIPIVFMTGRPEALNALAWNGPNDAVLLKPYGPSAVLKTVRRLLDQTLNPDV